MATLDSSDANILDAETINWRLIVYPILAILVLLVAGFAYYYHLEDQREVLESQAREALLLAKTAPEMVQVADKFPNTDTATEALLGAADDAFGKRDFDSALKDYQRISSTSATDPQLRDSAQLGLASTFEATGKLDDATKAYLDVAQRGKKSPYAPYAYAAAARLYEQRGDKENQRKTLNDLVGLDPDSLFVKQAQAKMKELSAATMTPPPPSPVLPAAVTPVPPKS